jgi:hypothetical protein
MFLFDQLRGLGAEVMEEYPRINQGGCCVFASLVAQALERKEIPVRGIVCMFYVAKDLNVDEVRPKLADPGNPADWSYHGIYFNHVGVEFVYDHDDYHYDVENLGHARPSLDTYNVIDGRLSVQELTWLAARSEAWNSGFDRRGIPRIKRLVKKYLK